MKDRSKGISAALTSAVFLGLAPIFGKQSIILGFTPLAVVAIRTTIAALLLLVFLLIFKRSFFYIYPLGLAGCMVAGIINGVGSILYYSALSRLDAGVGQLLYSFYPLFVAFWLFVDRQSISRITLIRLTLSLPAVYLLISNSQQKIDLLGALFMVGAALLYALHLLINQRVLFEVPAPTVTFYTLVGMTATVVIAYLCLHPVLPPSNTTWWPLLAMAFITFFARITLFMGVKHLGGLQTSLLGLGELLITVILAQIYLHESLTPVQWIGAFLISLNLVLVGYDKPTTIKRFGKGFLNWLNPPRVTPTDFPFQGQ
jgi:drug/metabolite transporter (DMT)-like permease